jgi:hypothetical protein
MENGLVVALAGGAILALALLFALRLRRGRERVIGGDDSDPVQRAARRPVSQAPAADAGAKRGVAGPLLGGVDLDELVDSRFLRKAVARADETGDHRQVVDTVMRLTAVSEPEAKAFIEKVRQRGASDD